MTNLPRLRANILVSWPSEELSIDGASLGPEGVRLTLKDAGDLLPRMRKRQPSPRPYKACTLTISILRSAPVADAYLKRHDSLIGDVTIESGDLQLPNFAFTNMVLKDAREMTFMGGEPTLVVTLEGYYPVNILASNRRSKR